MPTIRARDFLALAAACFAVNLAMLVLARASGAAPIVTPEAAVALGGLLVGGRRLWPAILTGTLAAYLIGPSALSFPAMLGLASAQAGAAWLAATLFDSRRAAPSEVKVEDAPLVTGAGLTAVAAAGAGRLLFAGAAFRELPAILASDAVGMLVVIPLLLSWAGSRPSRWQPTRLTHLAAIVVTTAIGAAAISFGDRTEVVAWSLFPLLVWSALAFQRRGAALSVAILTACLTSGTAFGHGPFAAGNPIGGTVFGQICVSVVSVTLLILAERTDARQANAQSRETARRLRERDEQLALFVDNVPAGVAILDRDMRYIAASRRYRGDCSLPADLPLIGRSHYEIFPDLPPRWRGIFDRVLAGEELSNPEEPWPLPEGKTAFFRWKMKPWRDGEGQIAGLMMFIEVVTEAVEARHRIEAAEARYRGVFDQAAVGVARFSLEGRYLEINDRACEILGRSREELLGADFSTFLPVEDIPADRAAAREMIAGGRRSYAVAKQIEAKNGGATWIYLTVSLIRDAHGEPECFVSVIGDITERKRAEAELLESEARLRMAQEAAGVGVWDMDLDRGVVIHTPTSLQMLCLPDDTGGVIPFDRLATLFDPEIAAEVTARLTRAVQDGTPYDMTFPIPLPDGGERWIHSVGRHEPGPGPLGRIRGASLDITAFRQSETRLVEAHDKLVRLSRLSAMGAMASTLAHELNQPLTAVANYTQGSRYLLEKRGGEQDEVLIDMIGRAASEALRAGAIIRKIRQFTITGEIVPKPEDLRTMVADAWAGESGRGSGVNFKASFGPGVATVLVDRIQMEQVFSNLIRNALEAMADSPVRRLAVDVTQDEGDVLIRVRDSGPGLSKDVLATLFDPFVSAKPNGMGLGLPICRTIVEAHGGRIWAENARGRGGAIFNILLPVRVAQGEIEHAG